MFSCSEKSILPSGLSYCFLADFLPNQNAYLADVWGSVFFPTAVTFTCPCLSFVFILHIATSEKILILF